MLLLASTAPRPPAKAQATLEVLTMLQGPHPYCGCTFAAPCQARAAAESSPTASRAKHEALSSLPFAGCERFEIKNSAFLKIGGHCELGKRTESGEKMLSVLFPLLYTFVLPHGSPAHAARRTTVPHCKLVTFLASRTVTSDAFAAPEPELREWFGKPEAIMALCSLADESRLLPDDRVEVVSRIPFPGMVAKSVTILKIVRDLSAPTYSISTVSSETVCESGPQWVRDLLVKILGGTKSTSDNKVTVHRSTNGEMVTVQSEVTLKVVIDFPGFLPLPMIERDGSRSLEAVLDKQMSPVLNRFRDDYRAWAVTAREDQRPAAMPAR
jgi:hypothetical protein